MLSMLLEEVVEVITGECEHKEYSTNFSQVLTDGGRDWDASREEKRDISLKRLIEL